jgi:hypothetical protein
MAGPIAVEGAKQAFFSPPRATPPAPYVSIPVPPVARSKSRSWRHPAPPADRSGGHPEPGVRTAVEMQEHTGQGPARPPATMHAPATRLGYQSGHFMC